MQVAFSSTRAVSAYRTVPRWTRPSSIDQVRLRGIPFGEGEGSLFENRADGTSGRSARWN